MTNISFNSTYLQDNYLGTYVSMIKFMTDTQIVAVLTYLCTLCFLLRASDWSSNVQRRKCRILQFTRNCPVTSAPWVWTRQYIYCWVSCLWWQIYISVPWARWEVCSVVIQLRGNLQNAKFYSKIKNLKVGLYMSSNPISVQFAKYHWPFKY